MKAILAFTVALLFNFTCLYAQFNPERQAFNKINKDDWNAAIKILNKALLKDSLNVEATYVYSLLYFAPSYSGFNVNTANYYKNKTIRVYNSSDSRSKERFRKFPLDSFVLSNLTTQLDSAAFEQAKRVGTENAYIFFLNQYPKALQTQPAIELRDEAAFVSALKQNTHLSFQNFIWKYPGSHRAKEAQQRFEKLLFENETRSKTLEAFQHFVKQYPTSPFAETAIKFIYDATTLDGKEESFESFTTQYPKSKKYKEASQFLLHIKLAKQKPITLNDSLKKIYPLQEWIPFTENSKWGFMTTDGNEAFPTSLNEINPEYLCEPLITDFIKTDTAIIGRNGAVICRGKFTSVTDIGFGFIKAESDSSVLLLHKSGKIFDIPNLEQAILIDSQFIACRKSNVWGLYSFTGQQLLPFAYEQINSRGQFIILSKSEKEILVELRNIISYAQGKLEPIVADEIKRYGARYFWIRNGALEKIIDERLTEVIPFDRQQITFGPAGLVVTKNKMHYLMDWPMLTTTPMESYQVFEPWLIAQRTSGKPALHFIPTRQEVMAEADSIWFDGAFAGIKKGDTIRLLQTPSRHFSIPFEETYSVKKSKDSVVYILTKLRNRTSVYLASSFDKVLTTTWSSIDPVVRNIFLINEKEKFGLMGDKNRILLQPEFDGILYSEKFFTLLKNRQFGIYNANTKQLLKPILDSNPAPYNSQWSIGRKGNKAGFISLTNLTKKIDFNFDEIAYWTDSLALVKRSNRTSIFSIFNKTIILDSLSSINIISNSNPEQLAIFIKKGLTGLIDRLKGIVIKPEFDELTFQRVEGELLFIGMKKLSETEAEIYHMNSTGKPLRRTKTSLDTAYSILCDN